MVIVKPGNLESLLSMINILDMLGRLLCAQKATSVYRRRDRSRKCCDGLLTWGPHWSDRGGVLARGSTSPASTAIFGCTAFVSLAGNMSSFSVPPPKCLQKPLAVPHRYMFGPGPSNVPSRILMAGINPVIGHMHPEIFEVSQWVKHTWCWLSRKRGMRGKSE